MLKFYNVEFFDNLDKPEEWELKSVLENSEICTTPEKGERINIGHSAYKVWKRNFYIENGEVDIDILCIPYY